MPRVQTAEDIEFNYHRMLGLGSGFTERSEYAGYWGGIEVESITATDSATVEIKLAAPNLSALATIIQGSLNWIYPPEVIREKGNADDWRDLVGTGPYTLADWTKGSSVTWDKNPDYWGFDEKFPDNRLPYFDQIRALIMPETTTYLSALRTGQIDYVGPITATQLRSIDQLESLQRTNQELVAHPFAQRSDNGVGMNIQLEPAIRPGPAVGRGIQRRGSDGPSAQGTLCAHLVRQQPEAVRAHGACRGRGRRTAGGRPCSPAAPPPPADDGA